MKLDKTSIIITLLILFVLGAAGYLYLREIGKELERGAKLARDAFDPTTAVGKANIALSKIVDTEFEYWHKGDEYLKKGQYEMAIVEYRKSLEYTEKYGGNVWLSHHALAYAYEKAGYYQEALHELNWLIAQKPRQEVLDVLIARHDTAEAALQGKFDIAAMYAKKAYELEFEATRQFYLIARKSDPPRQALEYANKKAAESETVKRYYSYWKHLESLAANAGKQENK